MARNIFKCTKRRFGRLHCAFMQIVQDPETGELEEKGCILGMRDEYRMYPEHNSQGDVIHNRPYGSSDPFPHGIDVIWENDTPHDAGLTYSRDGYRLRAEEYNMHPLYSITDINEPFVSDVMADDHVGYAFGSDNMSLSPSGWGTQKILGLQRVEDCNLGIYSKYDKVEKMILPKCIRDYTGDIKGWVNYTAAPDSSRKKSFFICEESDENLSKYCVKRFGKNLVAASIYQIMVAIKNGEYINLRDALLNHNLPEGTVNAIMREVSTKSVNSIYSNMNLYKYFLYWKALGRMNLSKEKIWLFRCHLLNYVLNYPPIAKKTLSELSINTNGTYPTNYRYWWVVLMVKDAFNISKRTKKRIITNASLKWLNPFVKSLDGSEVKKKEEDLKNPAVRTFENIVGERKTSNAWQRKKRVFARILRAGRRWSPPEVKVAWFYFVRAYDAKNPESFWQYVESVRNGTPHALLHIIQTAGIADEIEFSPQRAFAHHLLEARQSRKTFVINEPKLNERWQLITPKNGFGSHDDDGPKIEKSEIFWIQLKKLWMVLHKKEHTLQIISEHLSTLPSEKIKVLAEMYQDEINEDLIIGTELSKDDIGRGGDVTIVDIDGNEDTFGGEEWHDSESQE